MEDRVFHSLTIADQELWLLPERCIYWPEEKVLFLADFHVGKAMHFRKHGVQLPLETLHKDLKRLGFILSRYDVKHVVVLGDLFHSDYNTELEILSAFIKEQNNTEWHLVKGNHDIISSKLFKNACIESIPEGYQWGNFILHHYPKFTIAESKGFRLCGHLHPGIVLSGKGKQSLKLPCFAFNEHEGILPAFGSLTGLASVDRKQYHKILGIADGQLVAIP